MFGIHLDYLMLPLLLPLVSEIIILAIMNHGIIFVDKNNYHWTDAKPDELFKLIE